MVTAFQGILEFRFTVKTWRSYWSWFNTTKICRKFKYGDRKNWKLLFWFQNSIWDMLATHSLSPINIGLTRCQSGEVQIKYRCHHYSNWGRTSLIKDTLWTATTDNYFWALSNLIMALQLFVCPSKLCRARSTSHHQLCVKFNLYLPNFSCYFAEFCFE